MHMCVASQPQGTYSIDDDEAAILNWRVALAKGLGLSLALGAGLPYGTEVLVLWWDTCSHPQ